MIQSFLAVAETGSLSGAGRKLRLSQPTVGRQIQSLERGLGVVLFDRHARGFHLNDIGENLLPLAREMRAAIRKLELSAVEHSTDLSGTVRLTASVFVSHHILPPILARVRRDVPTVQLELVPSDVSENLLFREADIAVRMYRPRQEDIIARHVGDLELGAFAARSYLDRAGRPATVQDFLRHDLVGYDQNDVISTTMTQMGWPVDNSNFATRCDDQNVYWQLVRAGCGIGFCQRAIARADPLVEELNLNVKIPALPVWLAAPKALRQTPRLSRVWDILVAELAAAAV